MARYWWVFLLAAVVIHLLRRWARRPDPLEDEVDSIEFFASEPEDRE
jgi:hypothetical protein